MNIANAGTNVKLHVSHDQPMHGSYQNKCKSVVFVKGSASALNMDGFLLACPNNVEVDPYFALLSYHYEPTNHGCDVAGIQELGSGSCAVPSDPTAGEASGDSTVRSDSTGRSRLARSRAGTAGLEIRLSRSFRSFTISGYTRNLFERYFKACLFKPFQVDFLVTCQVTCSRKSLEAQTASMRSVAAVNPRVGFQEVLQRKGASTAFSLAL